MLPPRLTSSMTGRSGLPIGPPRLTVSRVTRRSRVDVGVMLQQHRHHGVVLLRDRPHERRLVGARLAHVDVGAMREQRRHGIHAADPRRAHERWNALRHARVGARGEQRVDDRRVAVGAGQAEWRDPEVVAEAWLRTQLQQLRDEIALVPVGRPVQRRRAVGPARVDVGVLLEQ